MTWIVASIPLWLLGMLFLGAVPAGICANRHKATTNPEINGYLICLMLSAALFYLAAWVAS